MALPMSALPMSLPICFGRALDEAVLHGREVVGELAEAAEVTHLALECTDETFERALDRKAPIRRSQYCDAEPPERCHRGNPGA